METWEKRIAKERDTDGEYAYKGMLKTVEEHFNIYYRNLANDYILGTYLECYDPEEKSLKDFLKICRVWHTSSILKAFDNINDFKDFLFDEFEDEDVFEWENGVYTTNLHYSKNISDNAISKMITIDIAEEEREANSRDAIWND